MRSFQRNIGSLSTLLNNELSCETTKLYLSDVSRFHPTAITNDKIPLNTLINSHFMHNHKNNSVKSGGQQTKKNVLNIPSWSILSLFQGVEKKLQQNKKSKIRKKWSDKKKSSKSPLINCLRSILVTLAGDEKNYFHLLNDLYKTKDIVVHNSDINKVKTILSMFHSS